jgi:hypothetical protein
MLIEGFLNALVLLNFGMATVETDGILVKHPNLLINQEEINQIKGVLT